MNDQLITHKTAMLAKSLEISLESDSYYLYKGNVCNDPMGLVYVDEDYFCMAYTQSLLQKWLREEYLIHIVISPYFGYILCKLADIKGGRDKSNMKNFMGRDFNSYEEALEEAICEALKLVENENNRD